MYHSIYKDRVGQWRWRYVSSNGRTIATSSQVDAVLVYGTLGDSDGDDGA